MGWQQGRGGGRVADWLQVSPENSTANSVTAAVAVVVGEAPGGGQGH